MSTQVITFGSATIWAQASGGAGWDFRPGTITEAAIVNKARVGNGHWIKRGGKDPARHELDLDWATTTPWTVRSAVEAVATVSLASLVIPSWGTFGNCRLVAPSDGAWRVVRSGDAAVGYLLSVSLAFEQYP